MAPAVVMQKGLGGQLVCVSAGVGAGGGVAAQAIMVMVGQAPHHTRAVKLFALVTRYCQWTQSCFAGLLLMRARYSGRQGLPSVGL